jgi:hypothetical protein
MGYNLPACKFSVNDCSGKPAHGLQNGLSEPAGDDEAEGSPSRDGANPGRWAGKKSNDQRMPSRVATALITFPPKI